MCIIYLLIEVFVYSYLRYKFYILFIIIIKENKIKQRKYEICGVDVLFFNVFDIDNERIIYNVYQVYYKNN